MLVVLICIELSDVIFAIDSIPAVVGITQVESHFRPTLAPEAFLKPRLSTYYLSGTTCAPAHVVPQEEASTRS